MVESKAGGSVGTAPAPSRKRAAKAAAKSLTVLILGGYGVFGARLARRLADDPKINLIVAGRSRLKAEKLCAALPGDGWRMATVFDRDGDVRAELARLQPDVVVDASGPFQGYRGGAARDAYRLARAAVAERVAYLDLADARGFVDGVGVLDDAARKAGVFALSGVSSFPVLTAAAVRRLATGLARVDAIWGGIAPSPFAGVGPNVVRAVASYAGRPIDMRRAGGPGTGHPFTESRVAVIGPPGEVPLRPRRFSLVDTPDLAALPKLWPEVGEVWMGAAPVPEVLHRALTACAWLVRLRLLPTIAPLAPLMAWVINRVRWGEHRGGMAVAIEGRTEAGRAVTRAWHLLAEGDAGPDIPVMAAEAVIRKTLDGDPPPPGARAAVEELELEDYAPLFAPAAVATGVRETPGLAWPLYRRLLGEAWERLPAPLRAMHDVRVAAEAEGRATVERGGNPLAGLVAALFGFPKAGEDVPVRVSFETRGPREIWRRAFAGRVFTSVQIEGRGRADALVVERFGPLAFALAVKLEPGPDGATRLRLVPRRWSAFGVPLPLWLAPRTDSYEHAADDRFNFHVEIGLPLIGRVVAYRGWLARIDETRRATA